MRNPLRAPAAEGWGPVPETLGREPKECIWEEDGRQNNGKPLSNEISENLAYSQHTKLLQNIMYHTFGVGQAQQKKYSF